MRGILLSLTCAFALGLAVPSRSSGAIVTTTPTIASTSPVYSLQLPDKKIEITVGERGAGVAWYRNPVWIAIGVLAVIVVLLLIVVAARSGGTTVIKD